MGSTRVIATCVLLLACVCLSPAQLESGSLQARERPNILFILTDDQDVGSVSALPNVRSQLVERGTTFDRAYATTPLCCPSRTSILRGQYTHNHKVWDNKAPDGGFERFQRLDLEASTVARWLDEAGYHTGYIGKYLNEYGSYEEPTTHVPPGWDRWIGYEGGPREQHAREAFKVNDQGNVARIDAVPGYDTDYFARRAETYVENRKVGKPWFLVVATNAAHTPADATARNDDSYLGHQMPKTPAFNEADLSDKATIWRDNSKLPEKCRPDGANRPDEKLRCVPEANKLWRDRMESLRDVDDMVGGLLAALRQKGFAKNTYVVFASDNGFALYQNRVFSKGAPYEPSQRIPLIIKGPGVPDGRVDHRLVANIDLAPTFAQWAGARAPNFVDGRSLVPVLSNPETPWRTRLLFENRLGDHDFDVLRTEADQVYIEYPLTGEREYYDLTEDPYQLHGQAERQPPGLNEQLRDLVRCAGASCRVADGGP